MIASHHGLVCLQHEKPFEGVNGSGKHNNWSISADGKNLLDPGDTPRTTCSSSSSFAASSRRSTTTRTLLRKRRLGRQRPPSGRQRGSSGDRLDLPGRRAGRRRRRAFRQALRGPLREKMDLGVPCCRPHEGHHRPQPHLPVRLHGQQVRVPHAGSQLNLADANIVLNTAVAERARRSSPTTWPRRVRLHRCRAWSRDPHDHQRIIFNGNGYSDEWPEEAERRGLPTCAPRRCPAVPARQEEHRPVREVPRLQRRRDARPLRLQG